MGNLQPLITQTLLPGTKEAYGQLPLQDFNLIEQQPITAYGQSKIKDMGICRQLFLFTLNFTLTPFIF